MCAVGALRPVCGDPTKAFHRAATCYFQGGWKQKPESGSKPRYLIGDTDVLTTRPVPAYVSLIPVKRKLLTNDRNSKYTPNHYCFYSVVLSANCSLS